MDKRADRHEQAHSKAEEHDADAGKGAVETDGRTPQRSNTTMEGQLPHRSESRLVKDNDTDFPEPGGSPEHSGQRVEEHSRNPKRDTVQQDPGERQKRNQGDEKDDPLAA